VAVVYHKLIGAVYSPHKDVWYTTVHVFPGTHHVKFIVDEQWRISDDYHKAVADDGSLANYIAIPIPAAGLAPRRAGAPPANMSFWSGGDDDASLTGVAPSDPRGWTGVIPAALVHASAEEEGYLAAQDAAAAAGAPAPPAPDIPPAPALPRFLEKLILNTRPGGPTVAGRDRTAERHRNRARDAARAEGGMPVTTASGTDISRPGFAMSPASPPPRRRDEPLAVRMRAQSLAGAHALASGTGSGAVHALADDASVLPVPSHVILHHLCTSAIRNGVLAVANTTRYRKKVGLRMCLRVRRKLTGGGAVPNDDLLQAYMSMPPALPRILGYRENVLLETGTWLEGTGSADTTRRGRRKPGRRNNHGVVCEHVVLYLCLYSMQLCDRT
jgi:hypothetical protein